MPCKKKEIRDIVYEYVYFTEVEEVVIEEPLFQRLRFVFQNSCAYLTYPSNQLTRFSHSLGVMHLGGDLFKNGITNSSDEDYVFFIEKANTLLLKLLFTGNASLYAKFVDEWNKSIGNIGEFAVRDVSSRSNLPMNEHLFVLNYIWQSMRLACLIHDIGHFPFSHVFEMGVGSFENRNALDQKTPINAFKEKLARELSLSVDKIEQSGATKLHEFFGAYILKHFSKKFEDKTSGNEFFFYKCLDFAEKVFLVDRMTHKELYENDDPSKIILCLHKIISSDIDADRLDYVLRDSISSGINLGNFDFRRITQNSKFFGYLEDQSEVKVLDFFVTDKALSSIEQFFNHRYLLYQHLYFHHNVSKYDGILIEVLAILLEMAVIDKNKKVIEILNEFRFIGVDNEFLSLEHIENYDDSWLRTFFQNIYRICSELGNPNLEVLLETFLFRKKQNTFSFIKKASEVDDFLKRIYTEQTKSNEISLKLKDLRTQYMAAKLSERVAWGKLEYIKYVFSSHFDASIKNDFLSYARKSLSEIGLVLIHKDIPPKIADKRSTMLKGNFQIPITKVSQYLNSFDAIATFSFKHYFGVIGRNIKSDLDLISKARDILSECLFGALIKCIEKEIEAVRMRNEQGDIRD